MKFHKKIVSVIVIIGLMILGMSSYDITTQANEVNQVEDEETTTVECTSEEGITPEEYPSIDEEYSSLEEPSEEGTQQQSPPMVEKETTTATPVKPTESTTVINQETDNNSSISGNSTVSKESAKLKLVTTDFTINKKGKAKLKVFTEADYKNVKKIKIRIVIKRKKNGKWKKVRAYKVVNESNLAFFKKKYSLKKKGTYRMYVKITTYREENQKNIYITKSKKQKY